MRLYSLPLVVSDNVLQYRHQTRRVQGVLKDVTSELSSCCRVRGGGCRRGSGSVPCNAGVLRLDGDSNDVGKPHVGEKNHDWECCKREIKKYSRRIIATLDRKKRAGLRCVT